MRTDLRASRFGAVRMVVGYDSFRNKSIQTTDQKCDVSII